MATILIYEDMYLDSFYGRNSSCAARNRQTSVLRKSKGLQLAIAKEITKGWFSQGDYNKLIHMFKACTQSNAAGQSDHTTGMNNISKILSAEM